MDNRSLLQKAEISLSSLSANGALQPAQAAKFMRLLIKESTFLPQTTVKAMKAPKEQLSKIGITGRVLHAGAEGVALNTNDYTAINMADQELDCDLFKAEVHLTNEVLEDSIERGELRNTVMQMFAEHIGRDMEEIVLSGDTALAGTDAFLGTFDGARKQSSAHVVDHNDATTNRALFKNMLKTLPQQYLRSKSKFKYFTSINSEIDYKDSFADRETALGDQATRGDVQLAYSGVSIESIPMMPENVQSTHIAGVPGQNTTNVLLMDPKNVNVGIWRKIRLETDKDIQRGVMIVVATLRFGCKILHNDAIVKATNVKVAA